MIQANMVKLAKSDTPMDDWHDDDDDESSVESDFQDDDEAGRAVVITMDDMSLASREFTPARAKSKLQQAGSFVSVLSTESSLEIDPVPSSFNRQVTQNATWNESPPRNQNDGKYYITFSPTGPADCATLRKEGISTRKGLFQRDNTLNDSCSSIKDLLRFGSIHEHATYDSIGSSDEEEESDEDDESSSHHDVPRNITDMNVLRNMMNKNDEEEEEEEYSDLEEPPLVDDSVVNMIIRKTIDNRDQARRAERRSIRASKHSMRNRIPKVKGLTGDPLLNRFLDARHHEKDSPTSSHQQQAIPSFLPTHGRLELNIHSNDLKFDSIMRKTDSLNHVNKQGQRVVKTLHEHHTASRRASLMSNNSHKDPLMERFLSSEARTRQRQLQHVTSPPPKC
jgi:hypothetical protein